VDKLKRLGWPVLAFPEPGQKATGRKVAIARYELPPYARTAITGERRA